MCQPHRPRPLEPLQPLGDPRRMGRRPPAHLARTPLIHARSVPLALNGGASEILQLAGFIIAGTIWAFCRVPAAATLHAATATMLVLVVLAGVWAAAANPHRG